MQRRRKSEERDVSAHAGELGHAVAAVVIAEFAAAAVLVDEQGDAKRFYGRTGEYLELAPGEPTRNVFKMAKTELQEPLRLAFAEASRAASTARQVRARLDPPVLLEVVPVPREPYLPQYFVVLFDPPPKRGPIRPRRPLRLATVVPSWPAESGLTAEVHQQSATREELRTANEELNTVNAELRSINEELTHNRDELRRREAELRLRNRELGRANLALKRAVQVAKAARDRATVIIEAMPVPVLTLDAQLRMTSVNRACCDFLGRAHDEIVGRDFLDLTIGAQLRERLRPLLVKAFAEDRLAEDLEIESDLPGLGRRTLAVGARAILSDRAERVLLLTLEDTTERWQRQEQRLREQANRAQRLLNEAGRLLLSEPLDSSAMLPKLAQLVVPEFGDLCAIDLIEGTDTRRAAIAHIDWAEGATPTAALTVESGAQAAASELMREGGPIVVPDLQCDRPDAPHTAWLREFGMLSCLGVPIRSSTGVLGALWLASRSARRDCVTTDLAIAEGLSQRAGLALERSRLYGDATAAVRVREEFMSIASHELRTPLTAVQLQLELLRHALEKADFNQKSQALEQTGRLSRQAHRMGRLIENLLSMSRLMAGKLSLEVEPLDLTQTATEIVERMAAEADRAGCKLELQVQGPVRGRFDPLRIEQVLTNLLTNAIRYAPGTTITVEVEGDAQHARIRVHDRGPGVPEERRESIFERFETAANRATSGLGLGLYISRQLIEAHGGTIRLELDAGAGASFLLELPRQLPE